MLYLSRKLGESIIINNNVELQVVEVKGKVVKLGFRFPPECSVLRKEIFDKISAENLVARGQQEGALDDFLSAVSNTGDANDGG